MKTKGFKGKKLLRSRKNRMIAGVCAESIAQKTQKKLSTFGFILERKAPKCDKCQLSMTCVWYSGKGPPQEIRYGERITDWISTLASC